MKTPKTFLSVGVLLFFAVLYFSHLSQRPMHNDESVNGMFVYHLIDQGRYRYDPTNFHGPFLYYLELIPTWFNTLVQKGFHDFSFHSTAGVAEAPLRSVIVIGGLLVLLSVLRLWRVIGVVGALVATLLLGFSCDFAYFSRYFIHEIFLVLFTLWMYLAVALYLETHRARYIYLFFISMALAFCTKETSVVHFFILGFAGLCAMVSSGLIQQRPVTEELRTGAQRTSGFFFTNWQDVCTASLLAVLVWSAFFSSFGKNTHGLIDSFRTFATWGPRGITSGHAKDAYYFLEDVLFRYDMAVVVLGFVGIVVAFLKAERKGLYLAFWSLGMVGAYSLIPYKTPWCVINLVLPLALVGGYGVQVIWDSLAQAQTTHRKYLLGVLFNGVALLIAIQIPRTLKVLFQEYDDTKHVQVYQHTDRDIYNLLDEVAEAARASNEGPLMKINMVSEETWPMPYYLRNYSNVSYFGSFSPEQKLDAPVLIVNKKLQTNVSAVLKDDYVMRDFMFRKGVGMVVFVQADLVDKSQKVLKELPVQFQALPAKANLEAGLTEEAFEGIRFKHPLAKDTGITSLDFNWEDEQKKYKSPFSVRWSGFINVDKSGPVMFSIRSDDGSWLLIDDFLIIENGGIHEPRQKTNTINLEVGLHKIELKYFDYLGEAVMQLRWQPAGQPETIIPPRAFLHER